MNPNDGAATSTAPAGLANAYQLAARDVVAQLQTDPTRGLSSDEAQRRLQQYGPNQLQSVPPVPKWRKFLAQFTNPLVMLLLVAVVISLIAWYIEGMHELPYEAIAIIAIVMLNAVIGYFQEARAEAAVAALQKMTDGHGRCAARWQTAAGSVDGPGAGRHHADRGRQLDCGRRPRDRRDLAAGGRGVADRREPLRDQGCQPDFRRGRYRRPGQYDLQRHGCHLWPWQGCRHRHRHADRDGQDLPA